MNNGDLGWIIKRPYPAYKDSGVAWLGAVPASWEVRRLKQVCRFAYGDALPEQARSGGPVAVYGSNGVVGSHNAANTLGPCIVIGRKGSFGKVNYAAEPVFAIDTTYYIDQLFTPFHMRWLAYLLEWLRLDAVSKDSAVPGLDRSDAYEHIVPVPISLDEQAAIVRYLNHMNRRVRRAIRAKRQLIALLTEQKQAVIHRAVTLGLDPAGPRKASGVEWVGEVPSHWEVQRLKRVCRVQGGYAFPANAFGESGVPVVRMNNLRRGVVSMEGAARIPEAECLPAFALRAGDILYGLSGSIGATGSLGNYAVAAESDLPAQLNQRVARFVPNQEHLAPEYLVLLIQTGLFYDQVLAETTGTAQFNVSTIDIENVILALPPLDEQRAIAAQVAAEVGALQKAIANTLHEIELLREYRSRLVADVITGQMDVRAVAATLPDEAEAPDDTVETENERCGRTMNVVEDQ